VSATWNADMQIEIYLIEYYNSVFLLRQWQIKLSKFKQTKIKSILKLKLFSQMMNFHIRHNCVYIHHWFIQWMDRAFADKIYGHNCTMKVRILQDPPVLSYHHVPIWGLKPAPSDLQTDNSMIYHRMHQNFHKLQYRRVKGKIWKINFLRIHF